MKPRTQAPTQTAPFEANSGQTTASWLACNINIFAPISGHKALSMYPEYIEDVIVSSLDELAKAKKPVEFLIEIRKITFRIIMFIFLSCEVGTLLETMEKDYTLMNHGLRAMAINLPGFAFHKALKARKGMVKIIQAHATLWATLFLHEHSEYYQKAKAEQLEILKTASPEEGFNFRGTKQMEYLSKVIDETLRIVNVSLYSYREAATEVKIFGYTIPRGWKVMMWYRGVHLNPEYYPDPKEFNPSRWNESNAKAGSFIPFGMGSRLCPGIDLTKLEITIFLHYFLLNYELERLNPAIGVSYLPHPRPKDNCLAKIKKLPSQSI
ncbi:hypothetical protein ACFX13_038265 [Malus domestica]